MQSGYLPSALAVDHFTKNNIPTIYFLTHFHADHYKSLSSNYKHGPIFMTAITKRLTLHKLNVNPKYLHVIKLNTPITLRYYTTSPSISSSTSSSSTSTSSTASSSSTCTVTAIDANHCPGAIMLLFQGTFGTILHTGDFRFHSKMLTHPALLNIQTIDRIYLDNTFLNPSCNAFDLLLEDEAIDHIQNIVDKHSSATTIKIAIDQCGKEQLLCMLAERYKCCIYLPQNRWQTLHMLELTSEQISCFTNDIRSTRFHMCSRSDMTARNLKYWEKIFKGGVIGIRPSGYAATDTRDGKIISIQSKPTINQIYRVKYSSHSSRNELLSFCNTLQPKRITATSVTSQEAISELRNVLVALYGQHLPIVDVVNVVNVVNVVQSPTQTKKRVRHNVGSLKIKKKSKLCIIPITEAHVANSNMTIVDVVDDDVEVVAMEVEMDEVVEIEEMEEVENLSENVHIVVVEEKDKVDADLWYQLNGNIQDIHAVIAGLDTEHIHLWTKQEDRLLVQLQRIQSNKNVSIKVIMRIKAMLPNSNKCQERLGFLKRHH